MIILTIKIEEVTPTDAKVSGTLDFKGQITTSELSALAQYDVEQWKSDMYKSASGIHRRQQPPKQS